MTCHWSFENRILNMLRENGYKVFHNGWPDCLVIDKEGNACMIEIKSEKDKIHKNQVNMLKELSKLGLHVAILNEKRKRLPRELRNISEPVREEPLVCNLNELSPDNGSLDSQLQEVERSTIRGSLDRNNGKVTDAAKELGITFESLRYRMAKLKIGK